MRLARSAWTTLVCSAVSLALVTPAVAQPQADAPPLAPPDELGPSEPPAAFPDPPQLTARAHLLLDVTTGQVLAASAAEDRQPVASTIKILTALTVLRRVELGDVVTVGQEVVGLPSDGATVGLKPGDRWLIEDLLEALVARSGNDAAVALAVHVGGSVPGFVELMRADAAQLGVHGVPLGSPDGLDDSNMLSSRDLARIARVALEDVDFAALASRPAVDLPRLGLVESTNELLTEYPGAFGVKTGFTDASGRCLVAAAERGDQRLLAIVLGSAGSDGHFADAQRLLDFGFERFAAHTVAEGPADLELRVAGDWVTYDAPAVSFHTPAGGPPLRAEVELPLEPTARITVVERWEDTTLGALELVADGPTHTTAPEDGAIGAWLADRAYAAMRAASATGAWPGQADE